MIVCSYTWKKDFHREEYRLKVNGSYTLVIHRHVYYPKDQWLLSERHFFDKKALESKDIVEAQKEAMTLVLNKLEEIYTQLNHQRSLLEEDK